MGKELVEHWLNIEANIGEILEYDISNTQTLLGSKTQPILDSNI